MENLCGEQRQGAKNILQIKPKMSKDVASMTAHHDFIFTDYMETPINKLTYFFMCCRNATRISIVCHRYCMAIAIYMATNLSTQ